MTDRNKYLRAAEALLSNPAMELVDYSSELDAAKAKIRELEADLAVAYMGHDAADMLLSEYAYGRSEIDRAEARERLFNCLTGAPALRLVAETPAVGSPPLKGD